MEVPPQKMQAVDRGGHSLLDESGTLRTGRWIKCGGVPHNKLLTSLLNLFGDPRASFGDSRVESSALKTPSLT